jgi:hypothetical protein
MCRGRGCCCRARLASLRNVAQRGVQKAVSGAGLGKVTPHDLRRSFCSLAGRRGVDPVEAAQITGHSPAVWARFYARSFGKEQRDEARDRLLEYGFGALSDAQVEGPLAPRSLGSRSENELSRGVESEAQEAPANERFLKVGGTRHCANRVVIDAPPLNLGKQRSTRVGARYPGSRQRSPLRRP